MATRCQCCQICVLFCDISVHKWEKSMKGELQVEVAAGCHAQTNLIGCSGLQGYMAAERYLLSAATAWVLFHVSHSRPYCCQNLSNLFLPKNLHNNQFLAFCLHFFFFVKVPFCLIGPEHLLSTWAVNQWDVSLIFALLALPVSLCGQTCHGRFGTLQYSFHFLNWTWLKEL